MLISYLTQMMVMFSAIIIVGLFLTWVNDALEHRFARFKAVRLGREVPARAKVLLSERQVFVQSASPKLTGQVVAYKAITAEPSQHDYAAKIVKIDLAPRSRAIRDETGEKLGEHVTVLPKAA